MKYGTPLGLGFRLFPAVLFLYKNRSRYSSFRKLTFASTVKDFADDLLCQADEFVKKSMRAEIRRTDL
ncbi:MAG: hypothetical protein DMG15_04160 [Acidobacteria bacterium]|nr:MAG: hypothetical protein DMG15_04160 [Acidobacteriota bacterium]